MHILLVDDDVELAEMLAAYFRQEGLETTMVHDGEAAVVEALSGHYTLVVLDIMMPGMSGIEVLCRVRLQSHIPVVMLTAKGDDLDRILGLELGADDYVPKPCTPRELVARVRAIVRRTEIGAHRIETPDTFAVGPLWMDTAQRKTMWHGELLMLTSTEFSLLEVLVRHAGHVVSKQELSETGLGRPLARFDRSIDMHMSSIRQKLRNTQDGMQYILTVRGKGYQFVKE